MKDVYDAKLIEFDLKKKEDAADAGQKRKKAKAGGAASDDAAAAANDDDDAEGDKPQKPTDTQSRERTAKLVALTDAAAAQASLPDGTVMAGGHPGYVYIFDTTSLSFVASLPGKRNCAPCAFSFFSLTRSRTFSLFSFLYFNLHFLAALLAAAPAGYSLWLSPSSSKPRLIAGDMIGLQAWDWAAEEVRKCSFPFFFHFFLFLFLFKKTRFSRLRFSFCSAYLDCKLMRFRWRPMKFCVLPARLVVRRFSSFLFFFFEF